MTDPGYYEQSYPPFLWAAPPVTAPPRESADRPLSAAAAGGTGGAPSPALTVTAGSPGAYSPPVAPGDRPRNLGEMRDRATPADTAPWPEGAYVQMGESGRRAHWTGAEWRGGESPGYPGQSEKRTTIPESSADTPDTEFPRTGGYPEDYRR